VGIVLRDKDEGVPYVFEHGLDGLSLIAFDTRLLFTRDTDVLIRVAQRPSLTPRENTTNAGKLDSSAFATMVKRDALLEQDDDDEEREDDDCSNDPIYEQWVKDILKVRTTGMLGGFETTGVARVLEPWRQMGLLMWAAVTSGASVQRSRVEQLGLAEEFYARLPELEADLATATAGSNVQATKTSEVRIRATRTLIAQTLGKLESLSSSIVSSSGAGDVVYKADLLRRAGEGEYLSPWSVSPSSELVAKGLQLLDILPAPGPAGDSVSAVVGGLLRFCPDPNEYLPHHLMRDSALPNARGSLSKDECSVIEKHRPRPKFITLGGNYQE
jgi:hypothetical protein